MENMKTFLPEADLAKLRLVLEIKDAYNRGTISLEEARKMLKEKVVTLKPYEIALAEQELKEVRRFFRPMACLYIFACFGKSSW